MAVCDVQVNDTHDLVKVFKMNSGQLSQLVLNSGSLIDKSKAYQFVKMMIVYINQFFGLTWNDNQINEVSKIFYQNYFNWHLIDLKVFSQRITSSFYNSNKNYSPSQLMEFAMLYDNERTEKIVEDNLSRHEGIKHDPERNYEMYRTEMNSIQQRKDDQERIKKMQKIIDAQKSVIKDQIQGA